MQLTKGAIGNLINRYRAVLKKCHLLNVFGSLAVAGMLVIGGAGAAGAVAIHQTTTGTHDYRGENLIYTGTFLFKDPIQAGLPTVRNQVQVNVGDYTTNSITSTGLGGVCALLGGHINLTANSISITSTDTSGSYSALWAQNNSTNSDGIPVDERASITINAENTNIKAANSAIVAMSNGIIEINGNLHVEAQNALLARGDAIISLNKSGESTVGIDGNINFNYDEPTSGTGVNATIDITLNGADSYWNGNTLISWNGTPSDPSKLEVSEMTLTVKDGATWTPTAIQNTTDQKYSSLNNLILDNGNIDVNKGVEIAIDKVTGTGFLANEGTVTLTSGALEGRTENAGIINLDPDASISNVTFVKGDGVAGQNVPGKGFISVDAEGAHLYGGMDFGNAVEASVSSVAVSDNTTTITGASISKADVTRDDGATSGNNKISSGITATLADGKSLAIVGSNFADNKVTLKGIDNGGFPDGALLRVDSIGTSGNLTISNTEFTGNTYTVQTPGALWNGTYGGIVAVGDNQGAVVMDNVTISGNTVTDLKTVQGAGYWQYGGSIEATGLTVSGNTASVEKVDDVTINGEPYSAGGAMALVKVEGSIKDSDFSNNTNKHFNISSGGALFVAEDSNITLENDVFNENTATGKTAQGGAIYNEGTLTVEGGSFTDNSAAPADGSTVTVSNVGGAIYNADDAKLSINGTRFEGNTAAIAGAVNNQYDSSHITGITNAFFVNNTASLSAGGALRNQGTIDSISGTTFEGNTAGNGGAL